MNSRRKGPGTAQGQASRRHSVNSSSFSSLLPGPEATGIQFLKDGWKVARENHPLLDKNALHGLTQLLVIPILHSSF